jgi:(R,R)-butanediol dehydrogenase / meso-butanediol dehydrogenase / diacetyl reductase
MKAAFYEGNEKIMVRESVCIPPTTGEVQIKVSYAGICGTDLHIFHGHMDQRVTFPQIMGHEMSGVIHAIGEGVSNFSIGDHVTVMPLDPCGKCPACSVGHNHICQNLKFLGIETPGAFQSFWTVPAYTVHRLPDNLSLKHAAMIEPLAVACHAIRLGEVKRNENVVVLGAGPIGMLIALVAKEAGANVFLSEINPFRLQIANQLGFETVNPKETDIVQYVNGLTDGSGADVVFEVSSSTAGAEMMTQLPRTRGRIVVVGIFNKAPKVDLHRLFWRELKLIGARVYENEDFERAINLAASSRLPLDELVTELYSLERLEEGFRQMESGGDIMKILLSFS